jgi:ribosomal protein L11 methyltransferase
MSADSWKVTLPCTRAEAEALTGDWELFADLDTPPVIDAIEPDESRPELWAIQAYFEGKPGKSLIDRLQSCLPSAARAVPYVERLPDADWVTLSQSALKPVHAGRFFVHTSSFAGPYPPGTTRFVIDASQAFGTGGHDTTSGCLAMLNRMARRGRRYGRIADIGTGTGLLAFAGQRLWPSARIVASDIDPVSIRVTAENAAINNVPLGRSSGQVALAVASGVDHALIRARAPYDLIIANILAGPLIELAPGFASLCASGGELVLAGLLRKQIDAVVAAHRAVGFRLEEVQGEGDWPVLRLSKRPRYGWARPLRTSGRTSQPPGDFGTW